MNLCSKPGCGQTGAVVLAYDYAARRVVLGDPQEGEISPHTYAMCTRCAEKLKPPRGWTVDDDRITPPLFLDSRRPVTAGYHAEEPEHDFEGETDTRQLFFGTSA
jgi:hypothetical protein